MDQLNPYRSPKMERRPGRFPMAVMILRSSAIVLCTIGLLISFISHGQLIGGSLILFGVFAMCLATAISRRMGIKARRGRVRAGWAAAFLLVLFGSGLIVLGSFRESLTRQRVTELEETEIHFESTTAGGWGRQ